MGRRRGFSSRNNYTNGGFNIQTNLLRANVNPIMAFTAEYEEEGGVFCGTGDTNVCRSGSFFSGNVWQYFNFMSGFNIFVVVSSIFFIVVVLFFIYKYRGT